jgi:outer membrane cobalamin receptor
MRVVLLLAIAVSIAGCASGGETRGDRRRDVISFEEIQASQLATAYDIIQALRPEFMRSRGVRSMAAATGETAVVYVDGVRAGGLEALRALPRETLQDVRYLSAADATTAYGTGHAGGVIQVRTRR